MSRLSGVSLVIRDRIVTILRVHGFLTTAQIAEAAGWVLESVSHNSEHENGVNGFYHTFINDQTFKLLACDGQRCLLSRKLTTSDQTVLRNCNALEKAGVLTKVKTPGVQAIAWYLNGSDGLTEATELEALWNAPAKGRS